MSIQSKESNLLRRVEKLLNIKSRKNERGGSDYGPFAKQLANTIKREDNFNKGGKWAHLFIDALKLDLLTPYYDYIDTALYDDIDYSQSSKHVKQLFRAIDNKWSNYVDSHRDDNVCTFFEQLADESGDDDFKEYIDYGFNDFDGAYLADDSLMGEPMTSFKDFINFYSNSNFDQKLRDANIRYDNLLKELSKVPDGGFPANKKSVIAKIKQYKDEKVKIIEEIRDAIKKEFPEGFKDFRNK